MQKQGFARFSEGVAWLKQEHGMGHGFANLITATAKQADAPAVSEDEQIAAQYVGKEHFRPIYDQLHKFLVGLGNDGGGAQEGQCQLSAQETVCLADAGDQDPVRDRTECQRGSPIRGVARHYEGQCHVLAPDRPGRRGGHYA